MYDSGGAQALIIGVELLECRSTLNPEHTFRKCSCLRALFRLFLGPLDTDLLDVSSDMYPEPSGTMPKSSDGLAEPVADRMRSTRLCPEPTPPEAILYQRSLWTRPYQGPCCNRSRGRRCLAAPASPCSVRAFLSGSVYRTHDDLHYQKSKPSAAWLCSGPAPSMP